MAFVKIPGFKGKVYIPDEELGGVKKHDCPDCYGCQMCSEVRCTLCRKEKCCRNEIKDKESQHEEKTASE
jgi:hypothetical protein